jgi:hypothetical protein
VVNSRVDGNFGSGALLYLTNDDFSRDWDFSGQVNLNEQRMSQYVVAHGNSFAGGRYDVIGATGRNILVKNNVIDARVATIAAFETKSSYVVETLQYQYFSNRVVGNTVQRTDVLGEFWGPPACPLSTNCALFGQYSIRDNRVADPNGYLGPARAFNTTYGSMQGPNTESGNCTGSSGCGPTGGPTPTPLTTSTPTPTSSLPTPTPGGSPTQRFPLGLFEDGNMIFGDTPAFTTLLNDILSHNLDSVFFGNNSTARDEPLLTQADQRGVGVVFAPHHELYDSWYVDGVSATLAKAHEILDPLVDRLRPHPSLLAYNLADEPSLDDQEKLRLAVQAVQERDPNHPSAPVLIAINTADQLFATARPGIFAADIYPIGADNPPCDFTMRGFGYSTEDFSSYIRRITAGKPVSTPLWVILQTHRFGPGGMYSLRTPSVPEVRAQHWMAIGEGATGIFWFIYGTQQDWTGLADNPTLFNEVGDLAARTKPLRTTLLNARRIPDAFTVSGGPAPYISTLEGNDGRRYAVVVNKGSCSANQQLSISGPGQSGSLRDISTGEVVALGAPTMFRPGDGRIFELIAQQGTSTPIVPTATTGPSSLVVNFDNRANGQLSGPFPTGEINWGTGQWTVNPPYGAFTSKNVSFFGGSISSATLQMLQPRALQRLQIYAEPNRPSTITLTCPGNPTQSVALSPLALVSCSPTPLAGRRPAAPSPSGPAPAGPQALTRLNLGHRSR